MKGMAIFRRGVVPAGAAILAAALAGVAGQDGGAGAGPARNQPVAGAAAPGAQAGGAIVVPAISFTGQGGGKVEVHERASEASRPYVHLWFKPGQWIEWTFDAQAGEYEIVFSYGARYDTRREVKVNGQPVKGLESVVMKNTGGWTAWKDLTLPAKVALKDGRNVLRITCLDDASLCLTRIRLDSGGKPILIDADRFSAQGGGPAQSVLSDEAGYFNMWDAKDHWLEWAVEAPQAGEYEVYLRYAALVPSVRGLQVNGEAGKGLESFPVEASGGWRYWVESKLPAKVGLKQGRNVLRLTNTEAKSLNLTAIRLAGAGGGDLLIRAVDFTGQGGGSVRVYAPSRHGYFNMWNDKGHWLEWTVDAPAAGEYEVKLTYSTKDKAPREVQVNGKVVKGLESVAPPPTGDWKTWKEFPLPGRVTLQKGKNVLRMTPLSEGGLNLDSITLTPAAK
jgi:hypothetical protein